MKKFFFHSLIKKQYLLISNLFEISEVNFFWKELMRHTMRGKLFILKCMTVRLKYQNSIGNGRWSALTWHGCSVWVDFLPWAHFFLFLGSVFGIRSGKPLKCFDFIRKFSFVCSLFLFAYLKGHHILANFFFGVLFFLVK